MKAAGILVDVTRCVGCEKCVAACVKKNGFDPRKADADRYSAREGLSGNRLLTILKVADRRYARKGCMHCNDPSCVAACLVGALTRTESGAVVYDAGKCIGCRYCMLACPFHVPRYEWDKTLPYVRKCDMCLDRAGAGEKPACVEACDKNALVFGPRDELLRMAHEKINAGGATYIDRVWGESEFGGTSVMYISDVDLSALGWPAPATASAPELALPIVQATPFVGGGVALGLIGLNWVIRRRMKLAEAKTAKTASTAETVSSPDAASDEKGER